MLTYECEERENEQKKNVKVLQWIKQYILFCQNKTSCKQVYIFKLLLCTHTHSIAKISLCAVLLVPIFKPKKLGRFSI